MTKQTAAATRPSRRPAREALLEAAARRFYAYGLTGTGIDTITAQAGVAKKSLYNNFASKADLVTAYHTPVTRNGSHCTGRGLGRRPLQRTACLPSLMPTPTTP